MPGVSTQKQTLKDPFDPVYYFDVVEPYAPAPTTEQIFTNSGDIGNWQISESKLESFDGENTGKIALDSLNETITIGSATSPTVGVGSFMGSDGAGGYDFRVGNPAGDYMWWDDNAATLIISGSLIAGEIHIPDRTTASSFHVDTSGNVWMGQR